MGEIGDRWGVLVGVGKGSDMPSDIRIVVLLTERPSPNARVGPVGVI
jgi:hypothetical protein